MTATDRLNAMQQRCDAATEGPWGTGDEEPYGESPVLDSRGRFLFEGDGRGGYADDADAEFIAAARTDLPATIAALRAVADLHLPASGAVWCTCGLLYPCDTLRAIEGALT